MGSTTRITIASIIAYLISQFHDVWLFHLLKKRFKHRHLWLRNNISTFLSQTLDTNIFIIIAFYGDRTLLPLIGGQLVVKWLMTVADTPFVYLLVGRMKKLPTIDN
ncbi:MAG: queuosine precursor transporter [Candidatus Marinimicrobia bacterium]|nr:queuosine precursor transporter [Candidatus Neomarinimicrobiota bacterium]